MDNNFIEIKNNDGLLEPCDIKNIRGVFEEDGYKVFYKKDGKEGNFGDVEAKWVCCIKDHRPHLVDDELYEKCKKEMEDEQGTIAMSNWLS